MAQALFGLGAVTVPIYPTLTAELPKVKSAPMPFFVKPIAPLGPRAELLAAIARQVVDRHS